MPLIVAEVFAHGARGVGRNVLQRSRFRGRGSHHDRVVHRACVRQRLHDLRDRGSLLANAAINANNVAALLIDDGVENHRGLAGLAVANDQFALAAPDGNHAVNRLYARLQRLAHRLAVQHARRNAFEGIALLRGNRAFAVQRLSQRIHHASHQCVAHGHGHDRVRALHDVAFLQLRRFTEKHHADFFFFQVEGDAVNVVRKSQHLAGHHFLQPVHARNAVADANDRADFIDGNGLLVILNLLTQNLADFVCLDVCHACSVASPKAASPHRRQKRNI